MRWIFVATAAFLDVIAAGCIATFAESGSKGLVFGAVLGVLWLLPLPVGIWALIRYWAIYHLSLKKRITRAYTAQFHKFEFPRADAFYDADQYLSHIMDDNESPLQAKLKAAAFVGELAAYKEMHGFTVGIAANLAFQDAMADFRPITKEVAMTEKEIEDLKFFTVR